jgi:hypothetical protein
LSGTYAIVGSLLSYFRRFSFFVKLKIQIEDQQEALCFFFFLRGDVAKEKEERERFCGICEDNLDKKRYAAALSLLVYSMCEFVLLIV